MLNDIDNLLWYSAPIMTYAASASDASTTDQMAQLQSEKTAVENILSSATANVSGAVTSIAASSSGIPLFYGNFGVTTDRDWFIDAVSLMNLYNLSASPTSAFSCSGDVKSSFPSGSLLVIDNGVDGYSRAYVYSSTSTSGASATTTVRVTAGTLATGIVTSHLAHVYDVTSTNGPTYYTSETALQKWMNDFDFAYDHLNHAMDATGTYGINARIAALSAGTSTMTSNKNKYDSMDATYREYSDWTPILAASGSNVDYIEQNQFICSGNLTSTFISGAQLLIDCGVDGVKGCTVSWSEYIPTSAASYTDCTIVMNVSAYMYSPSTSALATSAMNLNFDTDFQTMSISGGASVSGSVYFDPVTFRCPGDLTSILTVGTSLVADFNDTFTPRYFTVYAVEHVNDSQADHTKVTISNGLPLTTNISVVNILSP